VRVSYQYRIKPNTEQKRRLNYIRRVCQYLYNYLLADRLNWWEQNRCAVNSCPLICYLPELRDNPTYYSQKAYLPFLKEDLIKVDWSGELLDLSKIYSQVLQDVVKRVELAFKRYISGYKSGKRSGKPRFKSESTFKSFTYTQVLDNWLNGNYINLPKIGNVEIRRHRPLPNGLKVKTANVSKKADGWYVTLSLEDFSVPTFKPDEIVATESNSIGLDAVLHENTFLATSEGEFIAARKVYRKNEEKLAKVSKKKSARKKGSKARRKLAKREARVHQKIARSRKDHHFNVAIDFCKSDKKVIFVEDLELKNLTKRNQAKQDENGKYLPNNQSAKSGLNKSFLDAGFGQFLGILSYKVEKTGKKVVKVKPHYTSQICSCCDAYVEKTLSDRIHDCSECGIKLDRDINAAKNIKRVGLGLLLTIKRRKGKTNKSTLKEIQELT
jgi:putative transposase